MADWLDEPVVAEPGDWLDIAPSVKPEERGVVIVPKTGMPYDALRFGCMRGSGRVWACDGRYVAYRPFNHVLDKQVNPAFQERVERFTRAGHFKHVGTFDEVMVFQLEPESPWYAKTDETYVAGNNLWSDIRHAAKLACKRDWSDYHDLLQAMAQGMMAGREPMFARLQWEDAVNQIMITIYQMRGPTPAEIRAGIANIQKARGYGPKILLVSDVTGGGNVQRQ